MPAAAPLKVGDFQVLNSWVHDPKESTNVIFNHSFWPGVCEGDMLSVMSYSGAEAFVFIVPRDEGCSKPQLQVLLVGRPVNCRLIVVYRSQYPSLSRRLSN